MESYNILQIIEGTDEHRKILEAISSKILAAIELISVDDIKAMMVSAIKSTIADREGIIKDWIWENSEIYEALVDKVKDSLDISIVAKRPKKKKEVDEL
jgi:hypothetical protein